MATVRAIAIGGGTSGNLSCNKPTGTVDGDSMLAIISYADANSPSPPAGWTLLDSETTSTHSYEYWKIASSEGSSYTFDSGLIAGASIAIISFANSHPSSPIDKHSVNTDASANTTATGTAITPTAAPGGVLVFIVASDNVLTVSGYAVANNNPTWTEQTDFDTAGAQIAVATGSYDFVTTTGAPTATLSGSFDCAVYMVAIKPTDPTIAAGFTTATAIPTPAVSSAQTVAPSAFSATAAVPAPTVAQADPKWHNTSKNTASPTNTAKHTATATNVSKNSSSWTNTSKTP